MPVGCPSKITEGQAHDGRSAQDMLSPLGCGNVLLADRTYDTDALRLELAARGARANIKLMPNRVNLPPLNKRLYRKRNLVERFFNELKHFRAIATRYDKRDDNYLAAIKLASARICMRFNEPMTYSCPRNCGPVTLRALPRRAFLLSTSAGRTAFDVGE
jgi:transposase